MTEAHDSTRAALPPSPLQDPASPGLVMIVANPFSGSAANQKRVDRLVRSLHARNIQTQTIWEPKLRRKLLADPEITAQCRCVVAAGGDGTLADVVNDSSEVPVAILPLGNENLFAKQFGFVRGIDALAHAIERGQTHRIDLAITGERRFTVMLTAGFDAEVVHRVAAWRSRGAVPGQAKRRIQHLSYAPRVMGALSDYRYPQLQLTADGQTVEGTFALIFNVPRYACGLPFTRNSKPDDGYLDWVVFEKPGITGLLQNLWLVLRGKHLDKPHVHHGRARSIQIHSDQPIPLQTDGDAAGMTPTNVNIVPSALPVLAMPEPAN